MSKANEKKWYVAHTVTNSEKRAAALLQGSIKLEAENRPEITELFGRILVPEKVSKRDGKDRSMVVYPGYIFVEVVLNELTQTIIQSSNKISRITKTPLSVEEVNALLGEPVVTEKVESEFTGAVNDRIEIIQGPFKGMEANIEDIDHKAKKLKVSVQLFGRMNSVDLSFTQVKAKSTSK